MKLYIRFLNEYIFNKKNIGAIIKIILIITLTTIFSFSNAIISKSFINAITYSHNEKILVIVGIISFGAILVGVLISLYQNFFINYYIQNICLRMRQRFFEIILKMKWCLIEKYDVGELEFRFFSDISIITENASLLPLNLATSVFFILIINVFSIFTNWKIMLLLDVLLIFNGVLYYILQKKMEHYTKELQENSEALYAHMDEQLNNVKLIQLYNTQEKEALRTFRYLKKYFKAITDKKIFENNSSIISTIFISTLNIGILWIGGNAVMGQTMTLGDLTAFLSIVSLIIPISSQISSSVLHYPIYTVSLNRVYEVIDSVLDEKNLYNSTDKIESGSICFKDVSFSYKKGSDYLFENLNFTMYANKINILTGDSGLGKTTIFKLILKIYTDYNGTILIDKNNLINMSAKYVRKKLLYVGSTYAPLTHDTIYNNIIYGCKDAEYKDVINVAKLACIHEKIQSLPNGYFTLLGTKGTNFSDGEKQRLILARALIMHPKVLLLDEITANLDSKTEEVIMQNLQSLCHNTTIIFISHREIPQKYADNIINLNLLINKQNKIEGND